MALCPTGGATGDVILSDTADRIPDFWFFDLDAEGAFAISSETETILTKTGVIRVGPNISLPDL